MPTNCIARSNTLLLVAALLAWLPRPVVAAPADAESAIRRGVELRKKGDDEGALREFKHAYELAPKPRAAAQMGLAEQSLGHWPDAEAHLAEALASKGDPWVEKNRSVLEQSLGTVRARVGQLVVSGGPANAEVAIDGQPRGKLPVEEPLRLLPGPARLEVKAPGYASVVMTVSVPAGQVTRVTVQLERDRPLPLPDPAAAGPSNEVHESPPAPADGEPPHWLRTARPVSLIATGVALAVGLSGVAMYELQIRDFNNGCNYDSTAGRAYNAKGMVDAGCQSKYDSAQTGKTVAIAGFVGTGVLALTSSVLYFAF